MFGRVDLIDADARIRLAMQACRALTSALLQVVHVERLRNDQRRSRSVLEAAVWGVRRSGRPGLVAGTSVGLGGAREGRVSGAGVEVAPERVDAGVEVVRDLLEGLVRLPGHDLEARVSVSRRQRTG
jgi:hypothetical protein